MEKKMSNYGKLLSDYFNGNENVQQIIKRDDGLTIKVPIKFYFRDSDNLLTTEKGFYDYCKGKILCVGAGTGTHSLILENKGFDVLSIDISEDACEIMNKRGVKKIKCVDFFEFQDQSFDTITLLGRNIGMVGTIDNLERFLIHLKNKLNENGIILLNSYDLKHSKSKRDIEYIKNNEVQNKYYGEVRYKTFYNDIEEQGFNWLYLDQNTLKDYASRMYLKTEILKEEIDGNYLAILKK